MARPCRRQPPFVQSAATPASMMEAAGLADQHGTTDARDNEWLDVVAPSEYFSWLTVASLVLCAELFRVLNRLAEGRAHAAGDEDPCILQAGDGSGTMDERVVRREAGALVPGNTTAVYGNVMCDRRFPHSV